MKNTFLRTCILLLFCLPLLGEAQTQNLNVQLPLVTVTGTGEVKVQPDEVQINLGVETRSKVLEDARRQMDTKVKDILAALKNKGVAAKDVQTTYTSIYPVYGGYGPDRPSPDIEVYNAQKTLTLTLRQVDKLDELLLAALQAGANRVDGINYRSSKLQEQREQARKLATAAARQKANALAADLGAKAGKAFRISEVPMDEGPRPYFKSANMGMEGGMQADGSGNTFAPGQITVSAAVEVSFLLE